MRKYITIDPKPKAYKFLKKNDPNMASTIPNLLDLNLIVTSLQLGTAFANRKAQIEHQKGR